MTEPVGMQGGARLGVGGILKLPKVLQRDLILLFVVKLAMLSVLYVLFFSPPHRPSVDAEAHIFAVDSER